MKHTLLYIGLALASFMMQPAAVQAKARERGKGGKATRSAPYQRYAFMRDAHQSESRRYGNCQSWRFPP